LGDQSLAEEGGKKQLPCKYSILVGWFILVEPLIKAKELSR